jgi:hypothetical protein
MPRFKQPELTSLVAHQYKRRPTDIASALGNKLRLAQVKQGYGRALNGCVTSTGKTRQCELGAGSDSPIASLPEIGLPSFNGKNVCPTICVMPADKEITIDYFLLNPLSH